MKMISCQRRKVSLLSTGIFLFIVLILPFLVLSGNKVDGICVITFLLNGAIITVGCYAAKRRYPFSLELIYWIFMLIFMYFAPIVQTLLKRYPWNGNLNETDVFFANVAVFMFNLFFFCGIKITRRVRIVGKYSPRFTNFLVSNINFTVGARTIITIIVCCLSTYSLSKTGLTGIVVTRNQATRAFYSGNSSAIALIIESFIPAIMAYATTEAAQAMKHKEERCFRFLLLLTCLMICYFPTAIPRYKFAVMFGCILFVLFPVLKKESFFFWTFTVALLFVFPLLSCFRREFSAAFFYQKFGKGLLATYAEGDYDAYRMLVSAIRYGRQYGVSYGKQLLGVILFFVPRSIWPTKPEGSGAMLIRSELGANTFSNVSCPLLAEGFVNFGVVGIIGFAVLLGAFISKTDSAYWKKNRVLSQIELAPYLFLLFMLFFILRGDLLSGYAYTCGFLVTGYVLKKTCTKRGSKQL